MLIGERPALQSLCRLIARLSNITFRAGPFGSPPKIIKYMRFVENEFPHLSQLALQSRFCRLDYR